MLLNLIRTHAILHQATSKQDADGRFIATLGGYAAVRSLTADLFADGVEATVSGTIRETVEAVGSVEGPITVTKVARILDLDKSSAWRRVQTALEKEYLMNMETGKGRPAKLAVGEPLPDEREVLPTVESLIQGCKVAVETEDSPEAQKAD